MSPLRPAFPTGAALIPEQPRAQRMVANGLALLMHGLLAALLVWGVQWQTRSPDPVQAELWIPPAPPVPAPAPPPVVAPEPPKPAPPAPQPVADDAQIALERKRKQQEAEAKQRAAREQALKEKAAREKAEKEKLEKELAQKEEAAREKAAKEKLAREKADKERAEKEKLEKEKQEKERAEREAYLRRLQAQAGEPRAGAAQGAAQGAPKGTNAAGSGGGMAEPDYIARLASALRSNTTYSIPVELSGNPKAVFQVLLSPDCSVVSVKLKRSSGIAAWDSAAERGISRTDPFPRPRSGNCEKELEISRGPRDDASR
jgi:colicin import membrane protein